MSPAKNETKRPASGTRTKSAGVSNLAGISSEAVCARTGWEWKEWLTALDRKGAAKQDHSAIASLVGELRPATSGWWRQMVAVAYEQARGLREKHQKSDGWSVSGSRTLRAPVAAAYRAWTDPKLRRRWLEDPGLEISTATPSKSLRIRWPDPESRVEVNFYPKGADRSQVAVQSNRLPSAASVRRMKAFWSDSLDRLRNLLEADIEPAARNTAAPPRRRAAARRRT